eukprot:5640816-Alexandrium_andersonii.AAC.1
MDALGGRVTPVCPRRQLQGLRLHGSSHGVPLQRRKGVWQVEVEDRERAVLTRLEHLLEATPD